MPRRPLLGLLLAAVLLAGCQPMSVTGPCEVSSNSSITLQVRHGAFAVGRFPMPGTTGTLAKWSAAAGAAQNARAVSADALPVESDATDGASAILAVEFPDGWTPPATVSWQLTKSDTMVVSNGTAALDATPDYCASAFGVERDGYERAYYEITPTAPAIITTNDLVEVTVTFQTGVLSPGVYHPETLLIIESDEESCVPGFAFHRVTVGSPTFVNFDISSEFNSDVVINSGDGTPDATQDPLPVFDAPLAFATSTTFAMTGGGLFGGLPGDGLINPATLGGVLPELEGYPWDLAECLPILRFGWSDNDDGDNAWLPTELEPTFSFAPPAAKYSEITLLLTTGSAADPNQLVNALSEALFGIEYELTYSSGPAETGSTPIPMAGFPAIYGPLDGLPHAPTFTVAMAPLIGIDNPDTESLSGIASVHLRPDPTRLLTGISVTPIRISFNVSKTPKIETNAESKVALAMLGVAGAALEQPDVVITKQLLGGTMQIGKDATYRLTVRNDGDVESGVVTVTDPLPAQVTYVSVTTTSGSCTQVGGTVTCNVGTLTPGESETIDIVVRPTAAGEIENTASATMAGTEIDGSDNSATFAAAVTPPPIPSLSAWGAMLMALLLMVIAATRLRI